MCQEPGTLTVLVGPSGSGKSTLLNLLLRLFDPSSGEIILDGIPYTRIQLQRLRAQFAVMLQATHLFAGTVRSALQSGHQRVSDEKLFEVLKQVALDDFVHSLPDGLNTVLGEDCVNLSGGQRARLSLARALLLDRPILLLDEPLANVDSESQEIILDALDRTRARRTCLAVSHQPALVRRADVVLQLEHGRITPLPVRSARTVNPQPGTGA